MVHINYQNLSAIVNMLYDGDHFWKQQKWHLIMQESLKGLEEQMGMSYPQMVEKLEAQINAKVYVNEDYTFEQEVLDVLKALYGTGEVINLKDNKRQCKFRFYVYAP